MWKRVKNDLLYAVTAAVLALLALLPPRALLALARPLGALAWIAAARERRRALRNLERSNLALTSRQRGRLVRAVFGQLATSAMECVALPRWRRRLGRADGPVQLVDGSDATLLDAAEEGRGIIYVTGHLGNWELMAAAVARLLPVHVLARQSYDPRFTRLIERFRGDSGVEPIWVEQAGSLRRALEALRRGAVVGILLDQPAKQGGVVVDFLGRPAPTSVLAAALWRSSGAAVVCGFIRRAGPAAHAVRIRRIRLSRTDGDRAGDLVRATAELTRAIEGAIVDDPQQWLWTLDRWRDGASRSPDPGGAPGRRP